MRKVTLNEEQIKNLESLLGEVPMKWASPILNLLSQGLQSEESDPKPIGGGSGGGGSVKPKKDA